MAREQFQSLLLRECHSSALQHVATGAVRHPKHNQGSLESFSLSGYPRCGKLSTPLDSFGLKNSKKTCSNVQFLRKAVKFEMRYAGPGRATR